MAVNAQNIIVGAGVMYVAPYGTADNAVESALYDVGATQGGVELAYEPEFLDIEVDQAFGIIDKRKIRESATLTTQMAEATLNNLLLAWGLPAARLVNGTLSFGEAEVTQADARTVYIVGKGPNGQKRIAKIWKAVARGNASVAFRKDEVTILNVEFEILADTTKPAGQQMGQIVDLAFDGTAPTVAAFDPADAAVGIAVGAAVTVQFSDDMLLSTLIPANLQIIDSTTGANVCTGVAYDAGTKTATLAHAALQATSTYFVKISTEVRNASGVKLAAEALAKFTTV